MKLFKVVDINTDMLIAQYINSEIESIRLEYIQKNKTAYRDNNGDLFIEHFINNKDYNVVDKYFIKDNNRNELALLRGISFPPYSAFKRVNNYNIYLEENNYIGSMNIGDTEITIIISPANSIKEEQSFNVN